MFWFSGTCVLSSFWDNVVNEIDVVLWIMVISVGKSKTMVVFCDFVVIVSFNVFAPSQQQCSDL